LGLSFGRVRQILAEDTEPSEEASDG
jgi:hypothetical protein